MFKIKSAYPDPKKQTNQPLLLITSNPTPLDVISIDHLPTLLPRESSDAFSSDLLPSLLELREAEFTRVWADAERLFREKLAMAQIVE